MQYVVTNHNEGNFVILGPVPWNARYFSAVISDEVDEQVEVGKNSEQQVPFSPVDGITIRRCYVEYVGDFNPIIHKFNGPIWTYLETPEEIDGIYYQAKATYTVAEKDLNIIKDELKSRVAAERWKRENKGITLSIQGIDVWCDTSRGNRDIFLQKYLMMGENDIVRWKFPTAWLDLTKNDLGLIVSQGTSYIQQQFDWESNTVASIDSTQTATELLQIQIEEPQSLEGFEV